MSISPNALIGQFATAFGGAMASLGIESTAQALMSDGTIVYTDGTPGTMDRPLVEIDGSSSTIRDDYARLTTWKKPIALFSDSSIVRSKFLSDVEPLESVLDSRMIDVTEKIKGRNHEGHMTRSVSLRNVLKKLFEGVTTETAALENLPYQIAAMGAAESTLMDARQRVELGEDSPRKVAELFFISAALHAGLGGMKPSEKAAEVFGESVRQFSLAEEYGVAIAAVSEIPAWLFRDDVKRRDAYLFHVADHWDIAAKELHKSGDFTGAIIAIYRGLRAAALSKNYEAMSNLFVQKGGFGIQEEMGKSFLRAAGAKLKMYETGMATNEKQVLLEVLGDFTMARKVWDARTAKKMGSSGFSVEGAVEGVLKS